MKESSTFITSAAVTIFFSGCIIIAHSISNDLKQSLAALTGHHWISVSIISIILFVLSSGILLSSKSTRRTLRAYNIELWSTTLVVVTLIMILGVFAVSVAQFLAD